MREGSLEAPVRHALDWRSPDFYDMQKIEAEMHRVFDICHTCRRCFNLCDSFPRLFDLIDESATGELDAVNPADYKKDRKSTRLNSSHGYISYAVFCLKKKKKKNKL